MMRRGFVSFSNLQLGPPLRAENDEEEVDGCGDAPEEPPKPLTSSQQVHVHTRGLNEGYSQSWWLLQANKENVKTPVTFPRASESYRSANNSVDRGLPLQTDTAQETPSSTCPAFWNPGDATGETNRPVGRKLPPPSSNLPESSPALPSCKSDTRQGPTFHSHRVPHCVSVTTAAATKEEPDCKTLPREDGPPSEYAMSDSKGTFGSVSKQLDPIPRHPTSKPPIDYSSTRRNSKTTPNPKKVLFTSPEKRDVVIMPSPSGEERKFRKLALVGCGGSSKVYKVLGEDHKVYAVKEVYMKHVDPAIKKAYVNEVKLLTKLRDRPEIVTLYDYTWDKQEGILYLLLEFAEMDLNAVIRNNRWPDPILSAAYFWKEMVQVVKVIHDEDVIHNDLKPENFVCIGARLKLIDFGIASRIEAEKTSIERDIRCGTINYMAPETIETYEDHDYFKVGRPSDVWSLGCILYLMVYGKTPFEHIRNKLRKWHTITDPSIPIAFPDCGNTVIVDVMQQCLSRNPKERPTTTELLATPLF